MAQADYLHPGILGATLKKTYIAHLRDEVEILRLTSKFYLRKKKSKYYFAKKVKMYCWKNVAESASEQKKKKNKEELQGTQNDEDNDELTFLWDLALI